MFLFFLVVIFYPSGIYVFERALHLILSSAKTLAWAQTAPLPSSCHPPISFCATYFLFWFCLPCSSQVPFLIHSTDVAKPMQLQAFNFRFKENIIKFFRMLMFLNLSLQVFFSILLKNLISTACIPVSYTHLDVYKRQTECNTEYCLLANVETIR